MLDSTNATMVDAAAEATPVLPEPVTFARDAFDTPRRLAAELARVAKAYGHNVGDSDDEVKAAERVAAVLLPVLIRSEGGAR